MEWSRDILRSDGEVYKIIVQEKSLEKLKRFFKDASSLVEYSNVSAPYSHRRDSILALLVQTGDVSFFMDVWDHYFWQENIETIRLQKEFLKGTTSTGQRFNYHYFRDVMPPDVLLEEKLFLERDAKKLKQLQEQRRNFPKDMRTESDMERWEIYENIKRFAMKLNHYNAMEAECRKIKTDENQRLIEEIEGANFIWNKKAYPFSEILFKKGEGKKGAFLWDSVKGMKTDGTESLLHQVFRKLDFPENFFWAKTSLLRLETMLKINGGIEYADELLRFFEVRNGIVVIEKDITHENGNSKNIRSCTAYCAATSTNRPLLGLVSENIRYEDEISLRKILPHELTHAVECVSEKGIPADFFSKTDIMKLSFMALYLRKSGNRDDKSIGRVIDEATKGYKQGYHLSETLARIMEPRNFDNDPLVKNLRRLFMRYERAKLNGKQGVVKYIESMVERQLPNYKEVMKLYGKFEKFLAVDLKFGEQEFNRFFKRTKIEITRQEYSQEFEDFYRLYFSVWGEKKCVRTLEKITSKALNDLNNLENEGKNSKYSMFWRNLFGRVK